MLADPDAVAERLARLRARAISIAVDDFGTGYASLAYLTALPLDTFKIDRGLIADIVGGSRDRIVVKAMIRLARELDLKVVVEGVESTGQLALLADWGCDLYQGFLGAGALDGGRARPFRRGSAGRSGVAAGRKGRAAPLSGMRPCRTRGGEHEEIGLAVAWRPLLR